MKWTSRWKLVKTCPPLASMRLLLSEIRWSSTGAHRLIWTGTKENAPPNGKRLTAPAHTTTTTERETTTTSKALWTDLYLRIIPLEKPRTTALLISASRLRNTFPVPTTTKTLGRKCSETCFRTGQTPLETRISVENEQKTIKRSYKKIRIYAFHKQREE